jgi:hypothetical protein
MEAHHKHYATLHLIYKERDSRERDVINICEYSFSNRVKSNKSKFILSEFADNGTTTMTHWVIDPVWDKAQFGFLSGFSQP